MRDDWKPSVEDDPAGRDRGQRDPFLYQQEMREFDDLLEEHGLGCWDCEQVQSWLARMREHAA